MKSSTTLIAAIYNQRYSRAMDAVFEAGDDEDDEDDEDDAE
jgi:hypothetical protein